MNKSIDENCIDIIVSGIQLFRVIEEPVVNFHLAETASRSHTYTHTTNSHRANDLISCAIGLDTSMQFLIQYYSIHTDRSREHKCV